MDAFDFSFRQFSDAPADPNQGSSVEPRLKALVKSEHMVYSNLAPSVAGKNSERVSYTPSYLGVHFCTWV
jgi:hypothetical protein